MTIKYNDFSYCSNFSQNMSQIKTNILFFVLFLYLLYVIRFSSYAHVFSLFVLFDWEYLQAVFGVAVLTTFTATYRVWHSTHMSQSFISDMKLLSLNICCVPLKKLLKLMQQLNNEISPFTNGICEIGGLWIFINVQKLFKLFTIHVFYSTINIGHI